MRCKPSLPAVAHPRAAHADRTDAGHDLALWQMAVAYQPLAAIIGRLAYLLSKVATLASTASALKYGTRS
jgi:hypothetical protein